MQPCFLTGRTERQKEATDEDLTFARFSALLALLRASAQGICAHQEEGESPWEEGTDITFFICVRVYHDTGDAEDTFVDGFPQHGGPGVPGFCSSRFSLLP